MEKKRLYRLRSILGLLGSMKLAVVTLAALAIVLIVATFYESKQGTEAVMRVFYTSWWFNVLLAILGVTVLCSTLVRFPWKKRLWGFVLTHFGILAILVGAMVGLLLGKEGVVTLTENGPAVSELSTGAEMLQVSTGEETAFNSLATHLPGRWQSGQKAILVNTEKLIDPRALQVRVLEHFDNSVEQTVVEEAKDEEENMGTAMLVGLRSPGAELEEEFSEWLLAKDPERQILQMGPMLVRILSAETEADLQELLHPDTNKLADLGELYFKVGNSELSLPVRPNLSADKGNPKKVASKDGKFQVILQDYFADFQMDTESGKPVSVSENPNNPAVRYEIIYGDGKKALGFVFADYSDLNMMKVDEKDEEQIQVVYNFDRSMMDIGIFAESSTVYLIAGPEDQLHYVSRRPQENPKMGSLELNEVVPLDDWKMNPSLRVKQMVQNAHSRQETVPAELEEGAQFARPALNLELTAQGQTNVVLVQWNRPYEVIANGKNIQFLYGEETVPLGFSIQLLAFSMPTLEGTDMPASYESLVRVSRRDEAFERKIWMNHPMTYGGYRISQSGYSKSMGGTMSTLQLLHDPGSPLKWIGSILIMLGIAMMYFRGWQKS